MFLIKSWEATENFTFIAITKKKLCLIEVGGGPKSPPLPRIGLMICFLLTRNNVQLIYEPIRKAVRKMKHFLKPTSQD